MTAAKPSPDHPSQVDPVNPDPKPVETAKPTQHSADAPDAPDESAEPPARDNRPPRSTGDKPYDYLQEQAVERNKEADDDAAKQEADRLASTEPVVDETTGDK